MANEMENDVFTLDEEPEETEGKQKVRFAVLAVLALLVIAVAMYCAIYLTQARTKKQAVERETIVAKQEAEQKALDVNYWPTEQFPMIEQFTATEYKTTVENGAADVIVPPASSAGFEDYAAGMVNNGAKLLINTEKLRVLLYGDTEVHLVNENSGTRVVLCSETGYYWDESGYEDFPLPESGSLAVVEEGASAGSRILTYRMAAVTDALEYVNTLANSGWAATNDLSVEDNMFTATMKKSNMQITVDYFKSTGNYTVRLDFIG